MLLHLAVVATHGSDDLLHFVLGPALASRQSMVQHAILFLAGTHADAGLVCLQSVAQLHLSVQCMLTAILTCLSVVHTMFGMHSVALFSIAHCAMIAQAAVAVHSMAGQNK